MERGGEGRDCRGEPGAGCADERDRVELRAARRRTAAETAFTSRPISGQAPRIELVLGYHKENKSPLLKLFLSRVDDLVDRVSKKVH